MDSTDDIAFAELEWAGRPIRVEYRRLRPERAARPLLVFLHEGLGSLSAWKDFPARLCDATGLRGLVYSRPGYGRSTPRAPGERWGPDYLHLQAREVLPALLRALGETAPPWLFGHSDGGSIALVFAASFPHAAAGIVVMAPHIDVEPFALPGLRAARAAYEEGTLRRRLARHHADVDSAFHGWNDAWLDAAFAAGFDLKPLLPRIACPVLAIQGVDDGYGTLEQVRGIARLVPQARLLELADCGHEPQRDQPEAVIAATARFIAQACESSAPG